MRDRFGLDAADIRILSAVQHHGQLSKAKLAELVNLSPSPCLARLTRLREAGYIRGYRAMIALNKLADLTHVIVTLSLQRHRRSDFERFEAYVRSVDEIVHCVATGGGMDYVLTVITPRLSTFQALMEQMESADLNIDRYITYFVLRPIKDSVPNLTKLTGRDAL